MEALRFLAEFVLYAVVFGGICGALAAWTSRGGFSPMHQLVLAFRARVGASAFKDDPGLHRASSS